MLDFNHRPSIADTINALIDVAIQQERAAQPERDCS